MKTLKPAFFLLLIVSMLFSCDGEQGLPGPAGPQGPSGPVGLMYEIEFDLNSGNEWSQVYTFPSQDEILWSDIVLVYQLMGQENKKDIWRLMPINYYDSRGVLSVNYDFTMDDVNIFAEASFPLHPDADHFDNEIARIVVLPADESRNQRRALVNFENYEEVISTYRLKEPKKLKAKSHLDSSKL